MNKTRIIFLFFLLIVSYNLWGDNAQDDHYTIAIQWNHDSIKGEIDISNGKIGSLSIYDKLGEINNHQFELYDKNARLLIHFVEADTSIGPNPTVVHIISTEGQFSFFLRDVNVSSPVLIKEMGAVVLLESDMRSFSEVEDAINTRNLQTKIQKIESDPESSFESVAESNRNMSVPIWLGISRDMRMFEITEELEDRGQEGKIIKPMYASTPVEIPDSHHRSYIYTLGRGVGVKNNINRWLDQGVLPIYHSEMKDDDVRYHTVSFVSIADGDLTSNKGTNYVVSDKHSHGRTFKEEHMSELAEKMETAYDFDSDIVLYARTNIVNEGSVPRYAWIKTPRPGAGWWYEKIHQFDDETGFSSFSSQRVFCVSMLNGEPLPNEEVSVLLHPGETITYDFIIPHTPISDSEALELTKLSFEDKLTEIRGYWDQKLSTAASISVPERRIDEMIKAGLLHLDLITFGDEPDGTVSTNIGVYSPIGTESSPIIQFYLSMGWFDLAKRSINYFLETQLSSGYIQNYEGYTVETGAALWTMGEYIRYTNDFEWLRQWQEKILKSCDYLIQWRNNNKKDELIGRGYGMIDGKVADPEDHFHQFMLNGYGYLGLARIAEALEHIHPEASNRISMEAQQWKADILNTVENLWGRSPVVPLGNGTWTPTLPPWAEADGPRALFQKKETFWSHGTFTAADAMLGPLYLVFCEIIDSESKEARRLLDYHSEIFYQENSAFSQPYYSRHNWLQARLGLVKPFLNTYYNTISAHADRQTYTFWEHMYRVSPHKTHEEAWFLMETRWMLYMEVADTLNVFKTIPRKWLEQGKTIELKGMQSYFGSFDIIVESNIENGWVDASVKVDPDRGPKVLKVRLPHPDKRHPVKVEGGVYDPVTETITLVNVAENNKIKLEY